MKPICAQVSRSSSASLLRLAQTLPLDAEISEIPIERPVAVEAFELAISLVPNGQLTLPTTRLRSPVLSFGLHPNRESHLMANELREQ